MGIASFEKYAFSGGAGKCDDVFGEAPVADTICTGPLLSQVSHLHESQRVLAAIKPVVDRPRPEQYCHAAIERVAKHLDHPSTAVSMRCTDARVCCEQAALLS